MHISMSCNDTLNTYLRWAWPYHYNDVIMSSLAPQITSLTIVYSTVYSRADQRKHQSCAPLAFVWGIHRDRWNPRTKSQWRLKCFHLMTSWWFNTISFTAGASTEMQPTSKLHRQPRICGIVNISSIDERYYTTSKCCYSVLEHIYFIIS